MWTFHLSTEAGVGKWLASGCVAGRWGVGSRYVLCAQCLEIWMFRNLFLGFGSKRQTPECSAVWVPRATESGG